MLTMLNKNDIRRLYRMAELLNRNGMTLFLEPLVENIEHYKNLIDMLDY